MKMIFQLGVPRPGGASRYEMEMAFSRGLYTGWFGGTNNQQLVHARFGKKRGVFLGEVTRVADERSRTELARAAETRRRRGVRRRDVRMNKRKAGGFT